MQRSAHDFKHLIRENGLSFSQFIVLICLYHGNNCSISDIGKEMGVSNAAASQGVHRLVQMGLIERTENPDDRRSKQLTLTKKAHTIIKSSIKERGQWIIDLAGTLPVEQQQVVISALTILTEMARRNEN